MLFAAVTHALEHEEATVHPLVSFFHWFFSWPVFIGCLAEQAHARRRFAIRHLKIRKEFPYTPADQLFVKTEGLRVKRDEAIKTNVSNLIIFRFFCTL